MRRQQRADRRRVSRDRKRALMRQTGAHRDKGPLVRVGYPGFQDPRRRSVAVDIPSRRWRDKGAKPRSHGQPERVSMEPPPPMTAEQVAASGDPACKVS